MFPSYAAAVITACSSVVVAGSSVVAAAVLVRDSWAKMREKDRRRKAALASLANEEVRPLACVELHPQQPDDPRLVLLDCSAEGFADQLRAALGDGRVLAWLGPERSRPLKGTMPV